MIQLRIGIQTASLGQPLKQALHTAASLGAEAVEIDARSELRPGALSQTGLREFRKLLADLKLSVAAVGFPTRRGYDVLDDLDRRVAATREAMQLAASLRAPVVVNQVGRLPEDRESPQWRLLVDVLTELGTFGERQGVRLAAETGTEPGLRLAELVAAVPAGTMAVTLDPANLVINGFSPDEAVRALGPSIAHVHARDGVRDLAAGRGFEVPLGRGSVDFAALLGALEEHDYRGTLTIERRDADDPAAEIGLAVQYLRNL